MDGVGCLASLVAWLLIGAFLYPHCAEQNRVAKEVYKKTLQYEEVSGQLEGYKFTIFKGRHVTMQIEGKIYKFTSNNQDFNLSSEEYRKMELTERGDQVYIKIKKWGAWDNPKKELVSFKNFSLN